jgi:hypothetical protein
MPRPFAFAILLTSDIVKPNNFLAKPLTCRFSYSRGSCQRGVSETCDLAEIMRKNFSKVLLLSSDSQNGLRPLEKLRNSASREKDHCTSCSR